MFVMNYVYVKKLFPYSFSTMNCFLRDFNDSLREFCLYLCTLCENWMLLGQGRTAIKKLHPDIWDQAISKRAKRCKWKVVDFYCTEQIFQYFDVMLFSEETAEQKGIHPFHHHCSKKCRL